MRVKVWVLVMTFAALEILPAPAPSAQKTKEENVVKHGAVVSLEYTLSDEKGKVIESNKGKEPLKYTQGRNQIVPGLEKEIAGMTVGGEKHVRVKPEEGYGAVNPKAFQEVPKEKIPSEGLKVGTTLTAKSTEGQTMQVRVHEIKDNSVVLDLNHPLAGKTLVFDVKVLDVQATEPK